MKTKQIGIRLNETLIEYYKKEAERMGIKYTDLMKIQLKQRYNTKIEILKKVLTDR